MADSRLGALASSHGIDGFYNDIWGNRHEVPDETLRALLGQMHVRVESDGDIEEAIVARDLERRAEILAPATVVRQSLLGRGIALNLPGRTIAAGVDWRIVEERGARHSGSVAPGELVETARHEVRGEPWSEAALPLPTSLALGYHTLELFGGGRPVAATRLIVVPDACYLPPSIASGGRAWGVALQLYSLRSDCNWGVGDFTDLGRCASECAKNGAALVGVNPLHALFPHRPEKASPYSPSSRLFLNTIYLDLE